MLRAPITQPIDATSSVALVLNGPFAHGFADRAERRLLERPANAPSEKRVANLFTTVGGTRSNACSSTGGGGVCAEQSSAGIAKRRSSKKSVFRPSTPNCLTLEIKRFCNSSFPLARRASTSGSLTRPAALSASPLYISRLSRSRSGVESAGVSFWVSDTSVYLLR